MKILRFVAALLVAPFMLLYLFNMFLSMSIEDYKFFLLNFKNEESTGKHDKALTTIVTTAIFFWGSMMAWALLAHIFSQK